MTNQWYQVGMKPMSVPLLTEQQLAELDDLYRTTKTPRSQTRPQTILLSTEKRLRVGEVAETVRESDAAALRWLKRYIAERVEGLKDAPRPGRGQTVPDVSGKKPIVAVRRRPRRLHLAFSFSIWTHRRLADYIPEQTGT
jgi:hypothetical protein